MPQSKIVPRMRRGCAILALHAVLISANARALSADEKLFSEESAVDGLSPPGAWSKLGADVSREVVESTAARKTEKGGGVFHVGTLCVPVHAGSPHYPSFQQCRMSDVGDTGEAARVADAMGSGVDEVVEGESDENGSTPTLPVTCMAAAPPPLHHAPSASAYIASRHLRCEDVATGGFRSNRGR